MTNEEKHKDAIDYMANLEGNENKLLIETSQKVAGVGLPTELDMTHIKDLEEPKKNPNEEKIIDLALGGPKLAIAYMKELSLL